jgi:hypothetical protein
VEKSAAEPQFDAEPWQRMPGEPAPAYRAFSVYRDMNQRSLLGAYRNMRRKKTPVSVGQTLEPARVEADESHWKVPKSWYGWRSEWTWEERVLEYDQWRDQQDDLDLQRFRRDCLKELIVYGNHVVRPRIDALNEKINETIAGKLSKTTRSNREDGRSETVDQLRILEVLSKLCRDLEQLYFNPAKPLLDRPVPGSDDDEKVVVAGEFEWVDDPNVPPLPADHGTEDPSPGDE